MLIRYLTPNPCLFGRQALKGAVTRQIKVRSNHFAAPKSPLGSRFFGIGVNQERILVIIKNLIVK